MGLTQPKMVRKSLSMTQPETGVNIGAQPSAVGFQLWPVIVLNETTTARGHKVTTKLLLCLGVFVASFCTRS
jgi:hypothetical protein